MVEFEEILGYHLEQAWTYLSELGPLDERGREIGEEGSRRLASAGRRAFGRGDIPGAASLLGRAAALLPREHRARLGVLPDYGEALLLTGRFDDALRGAGRGHRPARRDARLPRPAPARPAARQSSHGRFRRAGGARRVEEEIAEAVRIFERAEDDAGLAMAYRLLGWSAGPRAGSATAADASALAIEHARRAGDIRQESRAVTASRARPRSARRTSTRRSRAARLRSRQTAGDRQSEGNLLAVLGGLYAMQGAFDRARDLVGRARSLLQELGLELDTARVGIEAWRTEMLAGKVDAAEEHFDGRTTRSRRGARRTPCPRSRPSRADDRWTRRAARRGARDRATGVTSSRRRRHRHPGAVALGARPHPRPHRRARRGRGASSGRPSRSSNPLTLRSCGARRTSISAKCSSQPRAEEARAAYEAARALAEERAAS